MQTPRYSSLNWQIRWCRGWNTQEWFEASFTLGSHLESIVKSLGKEGRSSDQRVVLPSGRIKGNLVGFRPRGSAVGTQPWRMITPPHPEIYEMHGE